MVKDNRGLFLKLMVVFVCLLILVLTLNLYFSDSNIGNKVGFGKSVTSLIK